MVTLEGILESGNMRAAYERVLKNKGSHGVDGRRVDELRTYLVHEWLRLKTLLLEGTYEVQPVRRVEIPKPDGGVRMLGIPTVVDRMIQQAIAQELSKLCEPTFSKSSYGFRPGRSIPGGNTTRNAADGRRRRGSSAGPGRMESSPAVRR